MGFFEGECRFYEELAEHSAIRTPHCYVSGFAAATGAFFTLLEDCSSSARRGDISAGCSRDEASAAVAALARFHASWWDSPALAEHSWVRRRAQELSAGLAPGAWDGFTARFGVRLDVEDLNRVPELLHRWLKALVRAPHTLLHADFKLDNLFFSPSGDITVIDWGLVTVGPPMFDVASFLALNLPSGERRAWERELIREYADVLAACDVSDYDFERAFVDFPLHCSRCCRSSSTPADSPGSQMTVRSRRTRKAFGAW